MLDQLVESRNTSAENTRRSEFLLGTLVILVTVLVGAWVYSLFNKEYGMGTGDLDISSLVAPVALPEEAPPPPPPEEEKPKNQSPSEKPTVIEKIATIEDTRVPPKETEGKKDVVSLTKDQSKFVDEGATNNLGNLNERMRNNDTSSGGLPTGGGVGGGNDDDGSGLAVKSATPTPKPTEKPVPKTISGGVVNGKATNLVKPAYPAAARAVRASGAVNVQVTIDESGNVISASAVSGHPLLRAAAVGAARSSKFSPTMLSGQAVKVTGVIVYNFVP